MFRRTLLWIAAVCWCMSTASVVATAAADGPAAANAAQVNSADPGDDPDGDGGTSSFYQVGPAAPGVPGTMVRTEDIAIMQLPTEAMRGMRMLYSSTDGLGSGLPVVVSGQVLLPKSPTPDGGWPVVAWEHGTTGVADICAPSWRGYTSRDRAYLNRWLDEGFAVVATDYQGLGTPGPHPYLLFKPEGYSVLDGLRAALAQYPGTLSHRIILVGQSQGSGAAVGTAWLAPGYAPELHILGVVATGLVVDFAAKPGAAHQPLPVSFDDPSQMDAAYAMLRVEGTDHSLHPDLDTRSAMTPAGIALSHVARTACLIDLFKRARADRLSGKDLFAAYPKG